MSANRPILEVVRAKKLSRAAKSRDGLCNHCRKPIPPIRSAASMFCSKECRQRNYELRSSTEKTPFRSRHARGAVSEMLVCIDLIQRGYEAFRAVNQFCSCDIVAILGKKLARIEVRTGFRNKITGRAYARQPRANQCDILAIVIQDGQIFYEPTIESFGRSEPETAA